MNIKSRRHIKKHLSKVVEQAYDINRLDYARRSKTARQEALLTGVIVAVAVYTVVFGFAFFGWKSGTVHEETLLRFSWIFMVPASAIGGFAYLFAFNRREHALGQDIIDRALIAEGEDGLLWRFGPLLADLEPGNKDIEAVIELSKKGDIARAEPEDYGATILRIHRALTDTKVRPFTEETAVQLERNFDNLG